MADGEARAAGPVPDLDERLRATARKLAESVELSRITHDPLVHVLAALRDVVADMAGLHAAQRKMHEAEKDLANRRLDVLDLRLDEIHQIHAELKEAGQAVSSAAKAEMAKASAEASRQAGGMIAAAAMQQFRKMTRTAWLRSVAAAIGMVLAVFVTGGALGFAWGQGAAARTIRAADPIVQFVAREEGAGAVRDWNTLMRYNPIKSLWAQCSGNKVAVQNGQKACNFWLWIGPPGLASARG